MPVLVDFGLLELNVRPVKPIPKRQPSITRVESETKPPVQHNSIYVILKGSHMSGLNLFLKRTGICAKNWDFLQPQFQLTLSGDNRGTLAKRRMENGIQNDRS